MKWLKLGFLTLVVSLFFQSANVAAQQVELEATYEIANQAKRGELQNVAYGEDGYIMSYVIRDTKRMIKMQHYHFDNDFEFIKMEEEVIELEKAKRKWVWFRGEAEGTQKQLLKVENNMIGQVALKKGVFVQKVDWYNGVSWWDFDVQEKTKPKDPAGRKLTLIASKTDEPTRMISYSGWSWLGKGKTKAFSDATGDVTLICSVLPKVKDMKAGITVPPYTIMRVSVEDQSILSEAYFGEDEFKGRPQQILHTSHLANGNIGVVFAPIGGPGMKNIADPDPLNFTYMEFNPQTAAIAKTVPIKSLNASWAIDAIVSNGDDIFIYGPAENSKNTKYANLQSPGKYSQFCLTKITGQELAWITNTNLEEFKSVLKGPPSQKKVPQYTGKKFVIGEFFITSSGDILINGQNTKSTADGVEYKDIFAFHFNSSGKLKAQYGVDIKETNKYAKSMPTQSLFRETQDGNSVAWIVTEVAGVKAKWGGKSPRALNYARISEIGLADAAINDFQSLGYSKEGKYYLENSFPILPTIIGGDRLTFFGSNKSGSEIWFGRVEL